MSGRRPRSRNLKRPRSRRRRGRTNPTSRRSSRRPPSRPPRPRTAPAKSFEERFGASWVVWIGGLALALGGIFLVQYSIEAGLIGPAVRVFLGGLLATGAGRGRRMDATARDRRRRCATPTTRTSRASSPPPVPPSRTRRSMRPTRSTASSCPAPPSCCSASWRSQRSPPHCCMGRRSLHSARSAHSLRRCSLPLRCRTTGPSTSISRS